MLHLFLFLIACAQVREEVSGKPPDLFAKAHEVHGWKSKNGLRYTWALPQNFDPMVGGNLTVILHGRGFDYRWGSRNHPVGVFRPADVVISVDGTSPDGENRWFAPEAKDATAFAAFLAEIVPAFKAAQVLLYGHAHGGAFALYFVGLHPDAVAGVVAHAAVPPSSVARPAEAHAVAIGFLAGTADPETSYRSVLDARDAYVRAGFPLVHLRRLEASSFEPDPRRAGEVLRWCDGMKAAQPEAVLAAGLDLARIPQGATPGQETAIDFSGARAVLRRLEGKGTAPMTDMPPEVAATAKTWIDALESAGAEHVTSLAAAIPKKKDLRLAAAVPLGHLVPLREDFRGVDSVESWLRSVGFDALVETQRKSAAALIEAWSKTDAAPKVTFDAVLDTLAKAWAIDGLPHDLAGKMREWHGQAAKLGLTSKGMKRYPEFEAWAEAWQDGRARYAEIWKRWRGP